MHVTSWEIVTPPGLGADPATAGSAAKVTLPAYPGLQKLSPGDLEDIVQVAHAVGIDPDWLTTIINFETGGSFSTKQKNAAGSGATGLIQFMPRTAQMLLGTSTPEEAVQKLEAMSFGEQMQLVERYFAPHAGKMKSLSDAYLAVLYPTFITAADDAVMGRTGDVVYTQNAGFDTTHKGYITKADITAKINSMLDAARGRVATTVPAGTTPLRLRTFLIGGAIVAAAGVGAWGVSYLVDRARAESSSARGALGRVPT